MKLVTTHCLFLPPLAATALTGCGQSDTATAVAPLSITQGTSCSLDGMLLADYPGPKAQIHYAGQAEPDFFCDTVEMFHIYLNPEQVRAVRGLFVQDMGRADWDEPRDHWIDAKTAFYVHGSKRHGSMGPTIASFAQETGCRKICRRVWRQALSFRRHHTRHGGAGRRRTSRQKHVSIMTSFFENLDYDTATEIEQLSKLIYELRDNYNAVLGFHGAEDEAALLLKIQDGDAGRASGL